MSNALADRPLPDASDGNWVDRRAPEVLRPWLKLARLDRPAGAWLLLLPGWQGIALYEAAHHQAPALDLYVRFAVGAVLMRGAGCAFNDIVDRDIDRKVARTAGRPVASGRISARAAAVFVVLLSLLSCVILLTMTLSCGVLGVLSLGLVAAYPFMKRITWWPQAWLGLTFNWGVLMGYAASGAGASGLDLIAGEFAALRGVLLNFRPALGPWPSPGALLLYASGVFWTLGYDTIYAVQDLEDDALAGVRSSARRLGRRSARGVFFFYLAAGLLALAAGAVSGLGLLFYPAALIFIAHLIRQSRRLSVEDPKGALDLFRSNRTAGLILLGAIALGVARLRV